ncbi:AfsR/SARP family transcriptional regulator [Nonomuraea sp. SYSU D8015]|uniref:AfsR/SARP family transcriptional regulator n=1 Tax=Nonomuraea sp. SYSU D8015 TaxID=2593644 RepID=UPI001660A233|nr:BTAD domain-containing putative transcriptional regulator [Nonomuraea sp. SYSU D8015]
MADLPNFGILGPLLVRTPEHKVRIAGKKPRLLLASLLLEANQVVGSDVLIEVLWPANPPSSAVANLRTYVSALRGAVGEAGATIVAQPSGYAVELRAEQLDALLFEDLVARARAAAGTEEAAVHLRGALALWRGNPLGDLPGSPVWDGRLRSLAQARLGAAEELVAAKLACEEYTAAIEDLRELIGEHPYREDLWQRLILALHRSGRRAEALHAYTTIRRQLVDDLGIEPGQDLRDAHAAVLSDDFPPTPAPPTPPSRLAPPTGAAPAPPPGTADAPAHTAVPGALSLGGSSPAVVPGTLSPGVESPAVAPAAHSLGMESSPVVPMALPLGVGSPATDPGASTPGAPSPGAGAPPAGLPAILTHGMPVPHQLPADVPDFTGRGRAVADLIQALSPETREADGPPSIAVVVGPPGVGKSALAVHCAHAVRAGYPEGQLYLCLDGTDSTPADPADLLAQALRALGVAEAALPSSVHERATLYRSLLAERPMLVLLDDAADAAQVRPLLPGSGCAVLVTSRRRITELPGALLLELDVLSPAEGVELLGRIAGADRVSAEREAARAILEACGHLPLAVRVAGARLAGRPGWSLRELQRRLADEATRLDELRAGDLEVRASFDLSYRRLPGEAAQAFRALALLGPASVPGWVADAVLDRHRADAVVDTLVDVSLLRLVGTDPLGQPRYRLHDLVRCTAREKGGGAAERQALTRVLGGWMTAAEHATSRLPTALFSMTSEAAPRWSLERETLGRLTADPLSWFDAERESLVEAVRLAARTGLAQSAWGLAATLVPYFDLHCRFDEWQLTHRVALDSAQAAGDRRGEAAMLRGLAQVCLYQDRYAEADEMLRRARVIFRELGDGRGEAISICGLGAVNQFSGRHLRALGYFRHALAMFLAIGDPSGEAYARQAIGRVYLSLQDLRQASRWLGEALRLAGELGDSHREGCVSMQLGRLHDLAADSDEAMRFQGRALDLFETLGDRHCGAYALQNLGGLRAARGDRSHGSAELQRSLAIFQQLGDRSGEADTFQTLGELYRSAGRATLASHYLHRAGELRRQLREDAAHRTLSASSS